MRSRRLSSLALAANELASARGGRARLRSRLGSSRCSRRTSSLCSRRTSSLCSRRTSSLCSRRTSSLCSRRTSSLCSRLPRRKALNSRAERRSTKKPRRLPRLEADTDGGAYLQPTPQPVAWIFDFVSVGKTVNVRPSRLIFTGMREPGAVAWILRTIWQAVVTRFPSMCVMTS